MPCNHTHSEINKFLRKGMQELTLRSLGQGTARIAYQLPCGEHVVKLARAEHCNDSQLAELEVWKCADTKLRKRLTPILLHGKINDRIWLMMPCVQVLYYMQTRECHEKLASKIEHWLMRRGIFDIHEQNLGFLNNRVVALDYASD